MKLTTLACLVLFGTSTAAFADTYGPYAGGSVGQTDYKTDGFDNPTSLELYGGVKFNQNLAAEISYNDFGETKDQYGVGATVSGDSVGIAGKVIIPLADNVEIYARAGIHQWNFDAKLSGFGSGSDNGSDKFFGGGVTFKLDRQFGVGLRYTKFDVNDGDIAVTALNGEFYF